MGRPPGRADRGVAGPRSRMGFQPGRPPPRGGSIPETRRWSHISIWSWTSARTAAENPVRGRIRSGPRGDGCSRPLIPGAAGRERLVAADRTRGYVRAGAEGWRMKIITLEEHFADPAVVAASAPELK